MRSSLVRALVEGSHLIANPNSIIFKSLFSPKSLNGEVAVIVSPGIETINTVETGVQVLGSWLRCRGERGLRDESWLLKDESREKSIVLFCLRVVRFMDCAFEADVDRPLGGGKC